MKNKLNITKGEWKTSKLPFLHIEDLNGEWICQMNDIKPNETKFLSDEYLAEEKRVEAVKQDNAILIADAGITYNECQILPSELLKQRNELLEALTEALKYLDTDTSNGIPLNPSWKQKAQQAIKNCEL